MRAGGIIVAVLGIGCGPKVPTDDGGGDESSETTISVTDDSTTGSSADSARPTSGVGEGSEAGEAEATSLPPWKIDVWADTGETGCLEWADQGCPLDHEGMTSLVHGTTPLGDFDVLPYAFFNGHTWCGGCIGMSNVERIVFVSDPGLVKDLSPWEDLTEGMEFRLLGFEGPTGQEIVGWLYAHRDGASSQTQATFIIDDLPDPAELADPFDPTMPAVVSGQIVSTDDPDWAVHGQFWALYCPQLNDYAICE